MINVNFSEPSLDFAFTWYCTCWSYLLLLHPIRGTFWLFWQQPPKLQRFIPLKDCLNGYVQNWSKLQFWIRFWFFNFQRTFQLLHTQHQMDISFWKVRTLIYKLYQNVLTITTTTRQLLLNWTIVILWCVTAILFSKMSFVRDTQTSKIHKKTLINKNFVSRLIF